MFFLTAAALPHLKASGRAAIINPTSVTAYRGSPKLLDYSATKGAIVSFTRSLDGQLEDDKNRVNGVAPGPIWIINGQARRRVRCRLRWNQRQDANPSIRTVG